MNTNPNPDVPRTRQLLRVARLALIIMSSTADLLAEAESLGSKTLKRKEEIYKQILEGANTIVNPDELRDQETALVKLGELYRDQK